MECSVGRHEGRAGLDTYLTVLYPHGKYRTVDTHVCIYYVRTEILHTCGLITVQYVYHPAVAKYYLITMQSARAVPNLGATTACRGSCQQDPRCRPCSKGEGGMALRESRATGYM